MKRILSFVPLPLLVMALSVSTASAWGPATHAYVGNELGNKFGYSNLQEMYGAMVPDFPWIMFNLDEEIRNHLGYLIHYEFTNVADEARWRPQKAFAYGVATHNEFEPWGADHWAHIEPGYTKKQGAALVDAGREIWKKVTELGLDPFWVAELSVEYGIDILIKENKDPQIGLRVLGSASLRSPTVPFLLARAYAVPLASATGWALSPFEAARVITSGEKQFRELIIGYGTALSQQDPLDALAGVAATQFSYLIETEPSPSSEELKGLAKQLLSEAIEAIKLWVPSYSEVLELMITEMESELEDLIPNYPL